MRRNIGIIDQTIRAILGLALVAVAAQDSISIPIDVLLIVVAAYLLVTAIVLHCPLYRVLWDGAATASWTAPHNRGAAAVGCSNVRNVARSRFAAR